MDGLHLPEHGMGGHYLQDQHHRGLHHHVIDGDDQGDIDNIGSSGTGNDPMDGDAAAELGNQSDGQGALVPHGGATENNNQLSLSFQGHVYLFESVSPEKVQAVLLLLGGREVPPNIPSVPLSASTNRALSTTPQKLNVPQRLASLLRFREKRKERNFDKKIRYTVRKEVALRMQRNKGQFTSSKGAQDESASVASSWGDSSQSWGNDGNGLQVQDISCRHCGTNEKCTPMMRRGPEGPRTLCNACGLMWANKGTLRDLAKGPTTLLDATLRNGSEENGNFDAEEMVLGGGGNNGHDSSC